MEPSVAAEPEWVETGKLVARIIVAVVSVIMALAALSVVGLTDLRLAGPSGANGEG